ncbi:MAG: hypothetical protein ACTJGH_00405 [Peptoniphilaceae bacterium]
MTPDEKLSKLKTLINEGSYPFFEDSYLLSLIETQEDLFSIARRLAFQKASIPEIKLGDVTIKPPKTYFYQIASSFRNKYLDEETGEIKTHSSSGKVVNRYDGRD